MCAPDCFHARFRQAEVFDLARLNQFLHRAGDIFDRHIRINAMLIEQINRLDLEPLERAFDRLLDVLGPAVQTCRSRPIIAATQVEPEFGGDDHFPAERSERFADKLFVRERAIDLSGIKECDATFHRRANQ